MKSILLFFLCTFSFVALTSAQETSYLQWQKSFGGSALDKIRSVKPTFDGGYIIAGHSFSNDGDLKNNHGQNDYWIIKLNADGNIEWSKTFGGSNYDYAISVVQTSDSGYAVAGYTLSNDGDVTGNHGNYDYWVIKLNKNGVLTWQKTFGGTGNDYANSIEQTSDGGYIVAGSTGSNDGDVTGNHGDYDFWVIKLNVSGNLVWQKTFGDINFDQAYSVQQTNDAGYIVAGYTQVTASARDYYIVKLDAAGNFKWQKRYGGAGDDIALSIQQTTNNGYIVGGYSNSTDGKVTGNHGKYDYWILKLNSNGTINWEKSLGGSGDDFAYTAEETKDSNYLITGISSSNDGNATFNRGGFDYWVLKLSNDGKIIWQKSLGGSANDTAYCGSIAKDGGYIIGGETFSNDGNVSVSKGGGDYWICKLSPDELNGNIKVQSSKAVANCSSTNKINFKMPNNTISYKVKLYRFGALYDSAVNVINSVAFNNLLNGSYYATATAQNTISTSNLVTLLPTPYNVYITNVFGPFAQVNWTGFSCVDSYNIQYRVQGAKNWKTVNTTYSSFIFDDLALSTTYVCKVASKKSKDGITATSKYSDSVVFTTASSIVASSASNQNNIVLNNASTAISVSPNPAKNFFIINYKNSAQQKINATLYDINGKAVWSSGTMNTSSLNNEIVTTTLFARGIYYLKLTDEKEELIGSKKIVITN